MAVAFDPRVDLFGIGDSLREARLRQGSDLAAIEAATCIRAANLDLIEEERWDALPGDVYTAGFIRTYAGYLGLDADRYVDVFKATRNTAPQPIVHEAVQTVERAPRWFLAAVVVLVAAGAAAAAIVLHGRGGAAPAAATTAAPAARKQHAKPKATPPPLLRNPLVLRATGGDSWVVVRFGSSKGELVWKGTLRQRNRLRLGLGRPLWVALGRPEAVRVHAGGKRLRLAPGRSLYRFSRTGMRALRR